MQEAFVRPWRMPGRVALGTVEPLVYRIALNLASCSRRLWDVIELGPRQAPLGGGLDHLHRDADPVAVHEHGTPRRPRPHPPLQRSLPGVWSRLVPVIAVWSV